MPRTAVVSTVDHVAPFNHVVHWQDNDHNWLLVADRDAHALVVYDATTGEPLRRLGTESGLGAVDAISSTGDRLLVSAQHGSKPVLLSLPQLQRMTLAAR